MFQFNKDQKKRDEILGIISDNDYMRFEPLSVEKLKLLLDNQFADPDECQNNSPSVQEFYDFMVKHPEYKAIGYAISLKRDDYRVSIEGLIGKGKDKEAWLDFVSEFRQADEFDIDENRQRCWYD